MPTDLSQEDTKPKYYKPIMQEIRRGLGLDVNDTSRDSGIEALSRDGAWAYFCAGAGFAGESQYLHLVHDVIYGAERRSLESELQAARVENARLREAVDAMMWNREVRDYRAELLRMARFEGREDMFKRAESNEFFAILGEAAWQVERALAALDK